jgi:uncharacterized protein
MLFEWDENKARSNLKKHGVSFEEATEVFEDPNALEDFDHDHSDTEYRFNIVGYSSRRLLFVVFVDKTHNLAGEELYRIIGARPAEGDDRKRYEEEIKRREDI